MAYFDFENGVTPLNDTNLNAMQQGLMELVFPIGSTYITQTDTNPSTILGFGTWQRLKGKVCLGLDENDSDLDTIGNTGGEKKHKLTYAETARGQRLVVASSGSDYAVQDYILGEQANLAHNIMQPYEVVGYMWIRRS